MLLHPDSNRVLLRAEPRLAEIPPKAQDSNHFLCKHIEVLLAINDVSEPRIETLIASYEADSL